MNFNQAVERFQHASQHRQRQAMIDALRKAADELHGDVRPQAEQLPTEEIRARLETYRGLRSGCSLTLQLQTPDMDAFQETRRQVHVPSKILSESWRVRPLAGVAATIWNRNGSPQQNLIFREGDELHPMYGRHASWKGLVSQMTPRHISGNRRGLLISDREISWEQLFDVTYDGENLRWPAGRSWLPHQMVHTEFDREFFRIGDKRGFVLDMSKIKQEVDRFGFDFCALIGGFRDVEGALKAGFDTTSIGDSIEARLMLMASNLEIPVIFGGLCKLGDQGVKAQMDEIHQRLFSRVEALHKARVTYVDCSTPSRALFRDRAWDEEGDFKRMFRANALFSLSQLVALTLDNLLAPSSSSNATEELHAWVNRMTKKRARDL